MRHGKPSLALADDRGGASARAGDPAREAAPRFLRFGAGPVETARQLLGQRLVRTFQGRRLAGRIVEVEAYLGAGDRASHTFGGRRTARNDAMWRGGGHAYVYFVYGLHFCLNVVCGPPGSGTAVLIRALEPTEGLDVMFARRPAARRAADLCRGPARLTQALAIDRALDGADLVEGGALFFERIRSRPLPPARIAATPRIGVDYAGAWARRPLRFVVRDDPWVSRLPAESSPGPRR